MTVKSTHTRILEIVKDNPGISGMALVPKLGPYLKGDFDPDMLEWLVETGQLVAVHYTTVEMAYREKTLYFPVGTDIKIEDNTGAK